jgi:hypothetical protein
MAQEIEIPGAPAGLPAAVESRWKQAYAQAFKEAKVDEPEQPNAWPQLAYRAANKSIRVPDPESFSDACKLEDWQVIHRAEKIEKGVNVLKVVTRDGRKFSFPVVRAAATSGNPLASMTKAELVQHAANIHKIELDPGLKKEDMIAKIEEQKK